MPSRSARHIPEVGLEHLGSCTPRRLERGGTLRVALAGAVAAGFLSFVVGAQAADPVWTATPICEPMSVAQAINDSGVAAGIVGIGFSTRAVVCDREGVLTYLPIPDGATASAASAINDLGQVAGLIQIGGFQQAAMWDTDGSFTLLGFLPGGNSFSSAADINNSGELSESQVLDSRIEGSTGAGPARLKLFPCLRGSMVPSPERSATAARSWVAHVRVFQPVSSALVWDGGVPVVLTPLAAGATALAEDINELGQIVGSSATTGPPFTARHPVLWDDGNPVDLGSLGGPFASAAGIDDDGQIVGFMSDTLNQNRGFSWKTGVATPLEPLSGDTGSVAQDVNSSGLVVGASSAATNPGRATMWLQQADTTPPELTVSVSPNVLWPPTHRYVMVEASATASDNVDPNPTIALVSVTSNEPDDGPGDGNTTNDILIDSQDTFRLRAERNENGTGRVYTITYTASDASGNSTIGSATVTVPVIRQP